ncbi:MAG: beta galactosidase jelly roll domain-containing protein, partial [Massilibacteroides sp.]|nr:beta galactosidase jelly roll domain-containing protein [Massilibacteroides sp.]
MNRKKILLWIGCFVFLLTEVSAQSIQNVMGRDCQSLNGTWNSLMDPFRVGQRRRFFDIEEFPHPEKHYDITFKGSLPVKVPSDWNSQYLEYRNYTGPMWYQRYFYYEPKATTGKVLIHIGAACQFATVYLNGQKLGQHEGGFAPFEFEVTTIIKKGKNNVVICVDNTRSKGTIPGLTFGWANYGGITRDVNLVCLPETYIDDYFIRLDKKDVHKLLIDVSLKGTQKTNKKLTIDLASKQIKPIELVTNAQ